jgi:hypothetical protein
MMRWQLQLLKGALIGILPLKVQENLRKIKRSIIPYGKRIEPFVVEQGIRQVEMLKASGCDPYGKSMLEIGAGWQPVIPLIFYLAGAKRIILVDIHRLLDRVMIIDTCRQLLTYKELISQRLSIPLEELEEKLIINDLTSFSSILMTFNFEYLALHDILLSALPEQSLDIITSRTVFEHIPSHIVKSIFAECYRLLKSSGIMCHIIDNSDHWADSDKTITRLNFLKYGDKTFRFIASLNPHRYQNRLRHVDYLHMLDTVGFHCLLDTSQPDERTIKQLTTININDLFKGYSHEELAILTSYIVLSK